MSNHSRRNFLKQSAFLTALSTLSAKSVQAFANSVPASYSFQGPISTINSSSLNSADFNGDDINFPHEVLWDLDGYIKKVGGIPYPTEKQKLVVVGGGISGLLAAYQLYQYNPVVLEQDRQFGGNSKGEKYNDSTYSIGAAYICVPDEGDEIDQFLTHTKLKNELRHERSEDVHSTFHKKVIKDFWNGVTDPARKEEFIAVDRELKRIYEEAYPDIPWTNESAISKEEYDYLDSITFLEWLKLKFGPNIHPHILEYFQLYCWSSFTASIDELSALQAINFVASEVVGILALPGGNAAIVERILEILKFNLPKNSLRTSAFVLKVQKQQNGYVWVTYKDSYGVVKTIECEACVVSSPKFVAKNIVADLPQVQYKQMQNLLYRGYIVANVFFDKPINPIAYDLFCLEGNYPEAPRPSKPEPRPFADFIFGDWANNQQTSQGVLTIYKPLAYDGARQFLFSPIAHEKHFKIIQDEIKKFLPNLGITQEIQGIRLTRWGHSLPVAQKNLLKTGYLESMNTPVGGKIFFANQDNFANPAFETAFAAASLIAKEVRKIL